jgi:hypothetical protein
MGIGELVGAATRNDEAGQHDSERGNDQRQRDDHPPKDALDADQRGKKPDGQNDDHQDQLEKQDSQKHRISVSIGRRREGGPIRTLLRAVAANAPYSAC